MNERTFDDAWKELEKLVAEIEDDTLSLDVLAMKVKEARWLIAWCEQKLKSIESDLEGQE
jgi:exodeoxyribonuclease VII small subunit